MILINKKTKTTFFIKNQTLSQLFLLKIFYETFFKKNTGKYITVLNSPFHFKQSKSKIYTPQYLIQLNISNIYEDNNYPFNFFKKTKYFSTKLISKKSLIS